MEIDTAAIERLRSQRSLVNKSQLAVLLGISWPTLHNAIKRGEVPEPERILGRPRWRPDRLADELDERRKVTRLTAKHIAKVLGVHEGTVREWVRAGKFPKADQETKSGRKFWKPETFERWKRENTFGYELGDKPQ